MLNLFRFLVMLIGWFILIQHLVLVSSGGYYEYFDNFYCRRRFVSLCRGKGVHVGCQFPVEGPGPNCSNYTKIVFSEKLKHFITHYINRNRQHVASGQERVKYGQLLPRPEIMMFVEWDTELAFLARRLADQCTFVHDNCRATARYPYSGQTVGEVRWRKSADFNVSKDAVRVAIKRILDAWWGEKRRVMPQQLTQPFSLDFKGATWGHFSQLAVWSLQAVGCGAVRHGYTNARLLLVCDFSHTNMLGQTTLTPGPLNDCPKNTIRKSRSQYPLLCVQMSKTTEPPEITSFSEIEYIQDFENEDVNYEEQKTSRVPVLRKLSTLAFIPLYDENDDESTSTRRKYSDYITEGSRNYEITKETRAIEEETKVFDISTDFFDEHLEWMSQGHLITEDVNSNLNTETERRKSIQEFNEFVRVTNKQEASYRRKWKKTRKRPLRPGASALLENKNKVVLITTEIPRKFTVDDDFAEQIFIDTGFKIKPTCDSSLK